MRAVAEWFLTHIHKGAPMSHSHKKTENPKKTRHDLEDLQEKKEMVEEAKAQLLDHNHLLKLYQSEAEGESYTGGASGTDYIKQPEDAERIAKNRFSDTEPTPSTTADIMQTHIQSIFTLQLQLINSVMESWAQWMDSMASTTATPDESARQ